jgi:SAM-dependent methyltransferase
MYLSLVLINQPTNQSINQYSSDDNDYHITSFDYRYGTYNDIQPFLRKSIQSLSNSILILGCGNSDFSSLLYDDGYHRITNIDFSELVIEEMKVKNISRHKMKWLVQDMTNMSKSLVVEEEVVVVVAGEGDIVSYDIIFDKGALDALYSMDTSESHHEACKMFHEIHTLMNESSRYICITLAQGFILQSLLHYFLQFNNDDDLMYYYKITIHRLHTKVESALLPFYIELQKLSKAKTITINHNTIQSPSISLFVNQFSESIDHPRQFSSNDNDITSVVDLIAVIQNYYQKQMKLTQFQLGNVFVFILIYLCVVIVSIIGTDIIVIIISCIICLSLSSSS